MVLKVYTNFEVDKIGSWLIEIHTVESILDSTDLTWHVFKLSAADV